MLDTSLQFKKRSEAYSQVVKVPFASGVPKPDDLVQKFKQLCDLILRELGQNNALKKQIKCFEQTLNKKLITHSQEAQAFRLIHSEDQNAIKRLKRENQELKEKIQKLTYSMAQSPRVMSPQERQSTYSIELVTKKPVRGTSMSFNLERNPLREINNTIY